MSKKFLFAIALLAGMCGTSQAQVIIGGGGSSISAPCSAFGTTTGTCVQGAGALGTPSSGNASNLTNIPAANLSGVVPAANGGAGSLAGLLKGNSGSPVSAATAGTDYAAPGVNHAQGTNTSATAAQWLNCDTWTSTGAFTLTLPATSTLSANGCLALIPAGGTITIQANGADAIWQNGSGGSAGGTLAVSGNAAILTTDAAGKLNVGWASGGSTSFANPTGTASDTANNGVATTAMRSDATPAIQKASSSVFGLMKCDGSTTTCSGGVVSAPGSGGGTVNTGTTGQVAYYAAGGTAVSGVGPGTTTTLLHGNASGAPSYAGVGIADHTATGTPSASNALCGNNTWGTCGLGAGVPAVSYIANNYYWGENTTSAIGLAVASTTTTYYSAITFSQAVTIGKLCAQIDTVSAGNNFQLGLYAVSTSTGKATGAVLVNTASISTTSSGMQCGTASYSVPAAGTYWVGAQADNTVVKFKVNSVAATFNGYQSGAATQANLVTASAATTYTTTGGTFGTWATNPTITEGTASTMTAPVPAFQVTSIP